MINLHRRAMFSAAKRRLDDLDKDKDSLTLSPTIALSDDLDKDADSLSLNVGITLEAI